MGGHTLHITVVLVRSMTLESAYKHWHQYSASTTHVLSALIVSWYGNGIIYTLEWEYKIWERNYESQQMSGTAI